MLYHVLPHRIHGLRAMVFSAVVLMFLGGCGFALRGAAQFAFETVAVTPERAGGVAAELSRFLGDKVRPLSSATGQAPPDAVVDILREAREKVVVGVNASGQVREFQLRLNVRFSVRTPQGKTLMEPADIYLQRDISFVESAVLAKEAEEVLLFRDMQTDAVQQIVRRMAAIKSLTP
jgi:LPS-assembly lipoprotein